MRKTLILGMCALLTFFAGPSSSTAAEYPTKPINVNCIFGAGGSTDLVLRVVADYATKHGYTMNVINKPGGGGAQAGMEVKKSRPDGYTLLFASPSFITLTQMKKVGCTIEDFVPIAAVTEMYVNFLVRSESPIKSFKEWMDKAKADSKYNYGTPGPVSSQRIFMTKLLKEKYGDMKIAHVPYTSGHDVNTALLGNHITAAFSVPGVTMPYMKSGQFRMLGVSSNERLPEFPDVPTFVELYGKDYYWSSFNGFFAPKNTPKEVIDKLAALFKDAMADAEVHEKMNKLAMPVIYRGPAEFADDVSRISAATREALKEMKL